MSAHVDTGLVIVRIGMGAMFVVHGAPKIAGGPEKWAAIGTAMKHLGIELAPVLWGFMAAAAECFGGILLALGVLFQPACAAMAFTMLVAAVMHLRTGDGIGGASHAIEALSVFVGLLWTGPGRYRLPAPWRRKPTPSRGP